MVWRNGCVVLGVFFRVSMGMCDMFLILVVEVLKKFFGNKKFI